VEFCDRTFFQLTIELEGFIGRWEDEWRRFRAIETMIFNMAVPAESRVPEYQIRALPSDQAQLALDNYVNSVKFIKTMIDD
jgi:hypothetical protein